MIEVPDVKLFVAVAINAPPDRIHPRLPGQLLPLGLFLAGPLIVIKSLLIAIEVVGLVRFPFGIGMIRMQADHPRRRGTDRPPVDGEGICLHSCSMDCQLAMTLVATESSFFCQYDSINPMVSINNWE